MMALYTLLAKRNCHVVCCHIRLYNYEIKIHLHSLLQIRYQLAPPTQTTLDNAWWISTMAMAVIGKALLTNVTRWEDISQGSCNLLTLAFLHHCQIMTRFGLAWHKLTREWHCKELGSVPKPFHLDMFQGDNLQKWARVYSCRSILDRRGINHEAFGSPCPRDCSCVQYDAEQKVRNGTRNQMLQICSIGWLFKWQGLHELL